VDDDADDDDDDDDEDGAASKHACVLRISNFNTCLQLQINMRRHGKQNLASLIDRCCK